MLETLLCLMPVMLMFMATVQASFLSVARLTVQHAAERGARTAIVVLEEDPKYFGDSPRGRLSMAAGRSSSRQPSTTNGGSDFIGSMRALVRREPSRLNAIRAAVYLPLSVIGTFGVLRNFVATAITFPQAPGSDRAHEGDYGPTDDITVRVTYLFECEVPLAAQLMCDKLYELHSGVPIDDTADAVVAAAKGEVWGSLEAARRARVVRLRLKGHERAMAELSHVEQPQAQWLLALNGGRFTTIQAEVTMPIQGAKYYARQP